VHFNFPIRFSLEQWRKYHVSIIAMTLKVQKWGNSLAIRIPSGFARDARLREGSKVQISNKEGKLVIEQEVVFPPTRHVYTLDELLAGITEENKHGEVDFGPPVGNEFGSPDSIYS
jgi:antitoxin MazE